ncbi:PRA1 family protein B4 [Camellia lanceoleosa]|uniref:PRA1 family protein B4 n=1 Tax=Camellia lanceoleosa TaxID=1840588 RepID=A0ACC0HSI5_9ERIC|nr:PRA1 family protein B4 [Camellia lanceoleosa]
MSSSLPLPISNPRSTTCCIMLHTTPPRCVAHRLSDSLRCALAHCCPWSKLADRSAFYHPDTISDAASRVRNNFSYFRVNYLTLLAAILALSLLSHPFSLLTLLSLLAAWAFLYLFRPSDQPVTIFSRSFSDHETLGVLILVTVVVIFLTSVGSLLLWATLVRLGIVRVHGAFRVPEDLFLDDQKPLGSGLFSFIGGAASSAAVAAAPSV